MPACDAFSRLLPFVRLERNFRPLEGWLPYPAQVVHPPVFVVHGEAGSCLEVMAHVLPVDCQLQGVVFVEVPA